MPEKALSIPSPEVTPTLKVKSPVTYLTPALTTSPSTCTAGVLAVVDSILSPSAKPIATVKSPVTALIPK